MNALAVSGIAIGKGANLTAAATLNSIAIGVSSTVSSLDATAIGESTAVSAQFGSALGYKAAASGIGATALGGNATAGAQALSADAISIGG